MPLLGAFDPPAYLPDFRTIPGQELAWNTAMFEWVSSAARTAGITGKPFPFFNAADVDPGGVVLQQEVIWNAFPRELVRLFGRQRALAEADKLWSLCKYFRLLSGKSLTEAQKRMYRSVFVRPQNEYCEWFVQYDASGRIRSVTFTSEPPDYWHAMYGGSVPGDNNHRMFPGDSSRVLQLYREFTGANVQPGDLIAKQNVKSPEVPEDPEEPPDLVAVEGYDPFNCWNTTRGIVHLTAPANRLIAEVNLAATACILLQDARGRLLVEPEALICCGKQGAPNRRSDPTIVAAVNVLARLGCYVTLANPIGLYIHQLDLTGWVAPDGGTVADCVQVVRGATRMTTRLTVEVPQCRGFPLGEITIHGEPIRYGGQIAECVTMKLIAEARRVREPVRQDPRSCDRKCCIKPRGSTGLCTVHVDDPLPAGTTPAYAFQGERE